MGIVAPPSPLARARAWFWPALAVANVAAALAIFREDDFRTMHAWTTAWLHGGANIYGATIWATDYPPNAIVLLSPLALMPYETAARFWMVATLAMAVATPTIAARVVRHNPSPEDLSLLTLTFLCWSGTRTLLQFSLPALALGLAAWRHAGHRPMLAGVLLGLACLKPQVALPFCLWVLLTRRWRVVLASVLTVAALWGLYCVRVGAGPIAVGLAYLRILDSIYAGRERLTGFSELKTLAPEAQADAWGTAIAVLLLAAVLLPVVVRQWRRRRQAYSVRDLQALPGAAAAAVLLAFRHMSLAFVTLLPAAAFLLMSGDAETRARRRPLFWMLQAGLIVDLPTLQRNLQRAGADLGWAAVAMQHFDRVLILALLLVLLTIQWRDVSGPLPEPAQPPSGAAW